MSCDLTKYMPPMMTGERLLQALTALPAYDPAIQNQSSSERLVALSALYDIYIPSAMTTEIYSKLYLALMRSLRKSCPAWWCSVPLTHR